MNEKRVKFRLGDIIKEYRQRHNLTLEQLGDIADLDANNIGRIERGEQGTSYTTLLKLVYALNIELLDHREEMSEVLGLNLEDK